MILAWKEDVIMLYNIMVNTCMRRNDAERNQLDIKWEYGAHVGSFLGRKTTHVI
jgi:hypothetical protein